MSIKRLKLSWPEHKQSKRCQYAPDFSRYHSGVAWAMQKQGIRTFGQLFDRVNWILGQPGMSDFFENIRPNRTTISRLVSAVNAQNDSALYAEKSLSGYSNTAELVAMALGEEPEKLFGPIPDKISSKLYCEAADLEGLYDFVMPEEDPSEALEREGLKSIMQAAVSNVGLTQRQRDVLRLLYEEDKTLNEVGALYGIGGEAVRHIVSRALRVFSRPDPGVVLLPYVKDQKAASYWYKRYCASFARFSVFNP